MMKSHRLDLLSLRHPRHLLPFSIRLPVRFEICYLQCLSSLKPAPGPSGSTYLPAFQPPSLPTSCSYVACYLLFYLVTCSFHGLPPSSAFWLIIHIACSLVHLHGLLSYLVHDWIASFGAWCDTYIYCQRRPFSCDSEVALRECGVSVIYGNMASNGSIAGIDYLF